MNPPHLAGLLPPTENAATGLLPPTGTAAPANRKHAARQPSRRPGIAPRRPVFRRRQPLPKKFCGKKFLLSYFLTFLLSYFLTFLLSYLRIFPKNAPAARRRKSPPHRHTSRYKPPPRGANLRIAARQHPPHRRPAQPSAPSHATRHTPLPCRHTAPPRESKKAGRPFPGRRLSFFPVLFSSDTFL